MLLQKEKENFQDGTNQKFLSGLAKSIFATALSKKDMCKREHKDCIVILTNTSNNVEIVGSKVVCISFKQFWSAFEKSNKLGYITKQPKVEVLLNEITLPKGEKLVTVLPKAGD